ncbi:MAG: CoA-binding protein [Candidatus Rifleibacteriota bacterium]
MNLPAMNKQRVAVLGASPNPDRYSHKAVEALLKHGHEVIPVHPDSPDVAGIKARACLNRIEGHVNTLTIYVSPNRLDEIKPRIFALKPDRVIFNPGTEHPSVMEELKKHGIEVIQACTLVMLATGQF